MEITLPMIFDRNTWLMGYSKTRCQHWVGNWPMEYYLGFNSGPWAAHLCGSYICLPCLWFPNGKHGKETA
jgi:hypothetical protein